jgi:ADP-heptose:LPS heptosyltransferase
MTGALNVLKSDTRATKLLAINFGGLGDEVLFLPTLQSIKSAHPEWRITLLTEPRGRSICDVTNLIDDNLTFDIKKRPLKPADYATLLGLVRGGKFDVVLSSGGSPMVAGLLFLSGIPKRIGYSTNVLARTLLTNPIPLVRNQHAAAMYHDLVHGLDLDGDTARPAVVVNPENLEQMRALLGNGSGVRRRVLCHPGTSRLALEKGIIKTWPPTDWAGLIERLLNLGDTQVVLAGGPDDESTVAEIVSALGSSATHPNFFNAYGKTASLRDLVALMELADVLVCVDSAPMHLGVGLNKRMVALFGPTDPLKLLWQDSRFVGLRDGEAAAKAGDKDPFLSGMKSESHIKIALDDVYGKTMEQLAIASQLA